MWHCPRGHLIEYHRAHPGLIFLVKEGVVKVSTYSADGKEQILALLECGDLFGEMGPVGEREPVRFSAFQDALVCGVRRLDFEALLLRHPKISLRIIQSLVRRLRRAENEIEDLAFRDVSGRLAAALLRISETHGVVADRFIRLDLRVTHQELANMIGATRETVTTALSRFRKDGLTGVDRRCIVIQDIARLRRLAGLADDLAGLDGAVRS